jgi:predicted metalloendopeptidase
MKKIIFLLIISAMGLNISASAQKAITTVHYYDVKNAGMEKAYIASLKEVNAIMIEIGYPNNYYTYMKLNESDTTSTYRNCTIGHWTSDQAYKAIHDNAKYKAWGAKNKDINGVFVSGQLYRKFYIAD